MGLLIRLRFTVVVLEPAAGVFEAVLEAVGEAILDASGKGFGRARLETPSGIATDANPGTPCPGAACNRGTITPNSTTASTAQTLSFSTVILESAVYATRDEDDGRFFKPLIGRFAKHASHRLTFFKMMFSKRSNEVQQKPLVTHGVP